MKIKRDYSSYLSRKTRFTAHGTELYSFVIAERALMKKKEGIHLFKLPY